MSKASNIKQVFAAGALAAALISAPFVAPAMADDHRGNRFDHRGGHDTRYDRDHRRVSKAEIRRHSEIRRHRARQQHHRARYAWNDRRHHRHGPKVVYVKRPPVKVVKVVQVRPRYDPQERLIASVIQAVIAASQAPHHYR